LSQESCRVSVIVKRNGPEGTGDGKRTTREKEKARRKKLNSQ